jgi:hypothetical protein
MLEARYGRTGSESTINEVLSPIDAEQLSWHCIRWQGGLGCPINSFRSRGGREAVRAVDNENSMDDGYGLET